MSRIERAMLGPIPGICSRASIPSRLENISYRTPQAAKHVCGFAISLNPKPICALLGKHIRDFIEPPCDVDVRARVHVSIHSRCA
jgi:hypothetical protein